MRREGREGRRRRLKSVCTLPGAVRLWENLQAEGHLKSAPPRPAAQLCPSFASIHFSYRKSSANARRQPIFLSENLVVNRPAFQAAPESAGRRIRRISSTGQDQSQLCSLMLVLVLLSRQTNKTLPTGSVSCSPPSSN